MKKITKLFLALTLLVIGVIDANAEIRKDWDPSDAVGTTWSAENTTLSWNKSWANVLYTGFAPKANGNTTAVDLSLFSKIHYNITSLTGTASDANGAYIDLKVRSTGKDDLTIKLREGANDIKFADYATTIDFSKILELTVSATYPNDAENGTAGSAVITEMYLYTDRYEYQTQKQTVTTNTLGEALSLNNIVAGNNLVSIVSGNNILYAVNANNQILSSSLDDAMNTIAKTESPSTYRFRISAATDATLPSGITTLYRIRAYKSETDVYTGPWGGDGYLTDLSWTWNIQGDNPGSYFDITAVEGKANTYKLTAYNKDGEKVNERNTEWTFNELTQTQKVVDVQVPVEVFVPDTEDPGIPEVADGWISLITNGKLDGDDVTNFRTKNEDSGEIAAVIDANAGRMGGPGIKVTTKDNAGTDWGTQFFVKSSTPLKEGQKLHIEFDYRADRPQNAATQVHRAPGDYNANIDAVDFTVNWKHYSNEITITSEMCKQDGNTGDFYLQSFGLNLSQIRTTSNFYFDNIVMWTEDDPLKPQRVELQNAIAKGNAQSSFAKTEDSFGALKKAITAGEGVVNSDDKTTLTNAKTAIENAITGLKLQDGYTKLTKDMYYNWSSATAPTYQSSGAGGCDYVIGTSTGQPYGNGNVPLLTFADLSTFDNLYVLATGGTPRILLNRDVEGGQPSATESESHLIDNTNANCMTWADEYFTKEGSNVTVDLKKLAANKGFAHLHTIKTSGGNVTVSDMLLYRSLTIGETGKATFGTLYKNAMLNGATVSAVKYVDGKVTLTTIENGTVPAGVGVLVEGEGEILPTFDVEGGSVDSDLKVSNGTVAGDGSTIYVLATGTHGVGFYLLYEGVTVPAGKAYLQVAAGAREFIGIAEDATAIKSVETVKANGAIYNLAGQQVKNAQKGVFIINGKKVIK